MAKNNNAENNIRYTYEYISLGFNFDEIKDIYKLSTLLIDISKNKLSYQDELIIAEIHRDFAVFGRSTIIEKRIYELLDKFIDTYINYFISNIIEFPYFIENNKFNLIFNLSKTFVTSGRPKHKSKILVFNKPYEKTIKIDVSGKEKTINTIINFDIHVDDTKDFLMCCIDFLMFIIRKSYTLFTHSNKYLNYTIFLLFINERNLYKQFCEFDFHDLNIYTSYNFSFRLESSEFNPKILHISDELRNIIDNEKDKIKSVNIEKDFNEVLKGLIEFDGKNYYTGLTELNELEELENFDRY